MVEQPGMDSAAPSLWRLAGELKGILHRLRFDALLDVARGHDGGGRGVLVFPGFMIHDIFTLRLRRTLRAAGYDARGWGQGANRGFTAELLNRMVDRVEQMVAETGGPIALVGWSLGGLYAREIARRRPELVERVVTLASPFSGDPRANNVWRLYERVAGHPVDRPPVPVDYAVKPPVLTIALWTAADGIVAPASTRGLPHERDHAVEVDCRHVSFGAAPAAIAAVLDALRPIASPPP